MIRIGRAATLFLGLLFGAGAAEGQVGVVVNEVYTGDPDYVEVANLSAQPVDISGWKLGASFGFSIYPAFSFPSGTVIASGECIVVLENAAPLPLTITPPPPGTQIFNTQFGYGWVGNSTGAVALANAAGQCQDLVVFGTLLVQIPPTGASCSFSNPIDRSANNPNVDDVVQRHSSLDTDSGLDWSNTADGSESPGALNPGQTAGPQQAKRLVVDPQSAAFSYDAGTGNLSLSSTVAAVGTAGGATLNDPSLDPLIGAVVTVTARPVGGNPVDFGGAILAPTTIDVLLPGASGVLHLVGALPADPVLDHELGGTFGATPVGIRAFTSVGPVTVQVTGFLSPLLATFQSALQSESLSLVMRLEAQGPRLVAIERSFAHPQPTGPLAALAHTGNGGLELGMIGAAFGETWHVFAVNANHALGAGPFFGIDFGPIQYGLALLPLGSEPFHVLPTDGTYHFATGPYVIPAGWALDHVAVQLAGGLIVATPPVRTYF